MRLLVITLLLHPLLVYQQRVSSSVITSHHTIATPFVGIPTKGVVVV